MGSPLVPALPRPRGLFVILFPAYQLACCSGTSILYLRTCQQAIVVRVSSSDPLTWDNVGGLTLLWVVVVVLEGLRQSPIVSPHRLSPGPQEVSGYSPS